MQMLRQIAALALFLGLPVQAAQDETVVHDQVDVTTSEGLVLKAVVSRAQGTSQRLPALFLTQAVSCGSVLPPRGSNLAAHAAEAGYALVRLDRSGTGESEGPGCDRLDYLTEVRHYREALDQLRQHPWIDPGRIVIYGSSLGSTTAPLVALDKDVAGVIVQGAGALTYFERMIHFDRLHLERRADFDPLTIDEEMRRRIAFHQLYLGEKMTPEAIAERHPELSGVWESLRGTDEAPHYGRPYAWHWQAAEQDWLAAWARIEAPVMVVYGEYEQFEARHGHKVIVDTVNRLRPGSATWLEIPRAGHGLRIYPDPIAAMEFADGESRPELFWAPVTRWLRMVAQGEGRPLD